MAEEKNIQPETRSAPQASRKRTRKSPQKRRQQSAMQYIIIMFAAVFALLLFTLLMERRANQHQIDDLESTSVSATQKLNDILTENARLKEELTEMEKKKFRLETDKNSLSGYLANVELSLETAQKGLNAMDWFWQIDEAYAKGKYPLCRSLIRELDEAELTDYLPTQSITDNGRFSPADRLAEIRSIVF